jgi:hypothetical protein
MSLGKVNQPKIQQYILAAIDKIGKFIALF